MDRERLHEMADLVMDANQLFHDHRIPHSVHMEVGWYPEICINTNISKVNARTFRYRLASPLLSDKTDPEFIKAEAKIRELVKEVPTNDFISA